MPDRLTVSELAAECRIGVFEWERARAQTVWMDLDLAIDAAAAAAQDDVSATVDYGRLVTAVRQQAQGRVYRLLETLAEDVAALILRDFPTSGVRVRVKKKALPGIGSAAVDIERSAQPPR
jgi:dihydroneopterin aldolase